jgi:RNA polymerase sigma factor (sigma-70 family)
MSTAATTANTDLELLRSYAHSRNADAFAELVRRHASLVFTVAKRLTANSHDAEDIAQNCFMELARNASSIATSPAGWLHRAATCRSRDAVRADLSRRQREAQAAARARNLTDPAWEDLAAFLDELIDNLPEELRAPLVLHYLQARSQADVARELGLDQSTISRRLAQAVEKLRDKLHKSGIVASIAGLTALLSSHRLEAAPKALIAATGKIAIAGITGPRALPRIPLMRAILGGSAAILLIALCTYLIYRMSLPPTGPKLETVQLQTPRSTPLSAVKSRIIPGVRTLGWNQQKENTFAGSLEAALGATAHPVDYPTIMGVSGLAFRIRWFDRQDDGLWDGSSAVGTMPHPLDEIRRGTGWTLRILWISPQKNPLPTEYMPEIIASIDKGIPVLGYEPKINSAVIYGYDDFGQTLLMNDYYIGAGGSRYRVDQIPVNFIIPSKWSQPQPPRDAALAAMKLAVQHWHRVHDSVGPAFRFWYGKSAYEKWAADVQQTSRLSNKQFASLFFVHWWNFTSLIDARAAAAQYLRSQQAHFSPETATLLGKAADHYQELAGVGHEAIANRSIFLGRWTGKSHTDWTDDIRAKELALLSHLRALDESAISELDQALSLEGISTASLKPPQP